MTKLNDLATKAYTKFHNMLFQAKEHCKLDDNGVSTLVEVAGILAIIVAAIIIVLPKATQSVSEIWSNVTKNANNFFNSRSSS